LFPIFAKRVENLVPGENPPEKRRSCRQNGAQLHWQFDSHKKQNLRTSVLRRRLTSRFSEEISRDRTTGTGPRLKAAKNGKLEI
jgi:hypothetical protein